MLPHDLHPLLGPLALSQFPLFPALLVAGEDCFETRNDGVDQCLDALRLAVRPGLPQPMRPALDQKGELPRVDGVIFWPRRDIAD